MNPFLNKNQLLLLLILLIYFFSSFAKFDTAPIDVDEYASILLANGIPYNRILKTHYIKKYDRYTNKDIQYDNTIHNFLKCIHSDGGNAFGFYFIIRKLNFLRSNLVSLLVASRILSCISGALTLLLIYSFTKYIYDFQTARLAGLLFAISPLAITSTLFIRTYTFSTFINLTIVFLFFLLLKSNLFKNKFSFFLLILFIVFIGISPFFHFFNMILIFLILTYILWDKEMIKKKKVYILAGICISIFPFILFYLFFNETGKQYQSFMNDYLLNFSLRYGSSENNYFHPATIKFLTYDFSVLIANLLSINFSDVSSYISIQMRFLLPIVVFFLGFFLINWTPKDKQNHFLIIIPTIFLFIYFLLAVWSGHVTSFFRSYNYLYYPFVIIIISVALMEALKRGKFSRILAGLYIILVIINYFGFILKKEVPLTGKIKIENNNTFISTDQEALLLKAVELQFQKDTFYFIHMKK